MRLIARDAGVCSPPFCTKAPTISGSIESVVTWKCILPGTLLSHFLLAFRDNNLKKNLTSTDKLKDNTGVVRVNCGVGRCAGAPKVRRHVFRSFSTIREQAIPSQSGVMFVCRTGYRHGQISGPPPPSPPSP